MTDSDSGEEEVRGKMGEVPNDQFDEIATDCGYDGWDGERALAVTRGVAGTARWVDGVLIENLPDRIFHIAPGADGTIGFESHDPHAHARKIFVEAQDGKVRAYWVDHQHQFRKFPASNGVTVLRDLFRSLKDVSETMSNGDHTHEAERSGDSLK